MPAQTASAQRGGPALRIGREELLALERRSPWRFMPLALQALEQAPDDVELRLTLVVAFARLGLNTLALEQLEKAPAAARREGDLPQLETLLRDSAGSERISDKAALRRAKNLCAALAERGVDLEQALERFSRRVELTDRFVAEDGNVVRRRAGGEGLAAFTHLADERGVAAAVELPFLDEQGRPRLAAQSQSCALVGVDPPWLLERLWRASPPAADGHQPRIMVLAPDEDALLEAAALLDMRRLLKEERIEWYVGDEALERFERALRGRLDVSLRCTALQLPGPEPARLAEPVDIVVERVLAAQQAEGERLRSELERLYAGRDAAWWARRYDAALGLRPDAQGVDASPLRVLIPTCLYSTYIRHSAADLARALAQLGCEAQTLIEPDRHSRFTQVAYLRRCAQWRPDLIVLINYTREHLRDALPEEVPFVCWIQDRMPHLFDEKLGAAQGELDFVAGHLFGELFHQCSWPRERAWRFPIAVSEEKFHPGPVSDELRSRFTCDVAYISHQSETPQQLHERITTALAGSAAVRRLLDEVYERICSALRDDPAGPVNRVVTQALRDARRAHDPHRKLDYPKLRATYAVPLAERVVRHRCLEWAAKIAEEEGLDFRLYGAGWEQHPTLAKFARGPVEHGQELRAAYQCAAAQLHISVATNAHQRVFECAMSGGLSVRLAVWADLHAAEATLLKRRLLRAIEEGETTPETFDLLRFAQENAKAMDGDAAQVLAKLKQGLGARSTLPDTLRWGQEQQRRAWEDGVTSFASEKAFAEHVARLQRRWILEFIETDLDALPDLVLPEAERTIFRDEQGLRDCLLRAARDRDWRNQAVRRQEQVARQRFGMTAFARELLQRVRDSLAASAAGRG